MTKIDYKKDILRPIQIITRKCPSGKPDMRGWSHWQKSGYELSHGSSSGPVDIFVKIIGFALLVFFAMCLLGALV